MRKFIEVVGVGNRRAGVSKDGKKYDFVPVSFLHEDETGCTNGKRAETVNVPGALIDASGSVAVGDVLDVVMHTANFRLYIDAIL